jgi:hypothetical protein
MCFYDLLSEEQKNKGGFYEKENHRAAFTVGGPGVTCVVYERIGVGAVKGI